LSEYNIFFVKFKGKTYFDELWFTVLPRCTVDFGNLSNSHGDPDDGKKSRVGDSDSRHRS